MLFPGKLVLQNKDTAERIKKGCFVMGVKRKHEDGRSGIDDKNVDGEEDGNQMLQNMPLHPLLQGDISKLMKGSEAGIAEENGRGYGRGQKKNVLNPILSDWKQREGFTLNPYVEQDEISRRPEHRRVVINLNRGGSGVVSQSERAQNVRDRIREERLANEREEELRRLNLVADISRGEEKYEEEGLRMPPYVEWWDEKYLKKKGRVSGYKEVIYGKDSQPDEDPITSYIQHPVPLDAPWRKLRVELKPLYLTKQERKKLRRNRRMAETKEKQDRIKLGLESVPKNKVKLKNLVNVLTNESVLNPTEVEMKVREEIAERKSGHERMNEERKLNREDRREKVERKREEDVRRGLFCGVYCVGRLVNPKHRYKVDVNAKELGLHGVCLTLVGGKSVIIVEGGIKTLEKYKALLLRRIRWQENERAKGAREDCELEDLATNSCTLVWEGELPDFRFHKWTSYVFEEEASVLEFLSKFGVENYWREAR